MARKRQRSTQPVRAPSGGAYGDRQRLEQAQAAIPLPASGATTGGAPPPSPAAGVPPPPVPVVAPTRPDIYAPAGDRMPGPEPILPDDPTEFLRAVYMQFPSPGLRDLIERASRL